MQSNLKDYYESIYKPSLKLINLYVSQSFFTFSYIYFLGIMGENISANLKVNLFNKIIKQDISFYDKTRSGELIDRFFVFVFNEIKMKHPTCFHDLFLKFK